MDDSQGVIIDLELIDDGIDKLPGGDQGIIETFRGKKNSIRLGSPRYRSYLAELLQQQQTLPMEIEELIKKGNDFQWISSSLTLLPARDCVFASVDFAIELVAVSRSDGAELKERPIVYDLKPKEVVRNISYRESIETGHEIRGEAKGGVGKLLAALTQQKSFEQNGMRLIRDIYGYGVNFSEAGWRLQASRDWELAGDIRDLELVVQIPQGSRLQGRFHIAAEIAVQAALDRWLTRAFVPRSDSPVVQARYDLSD